MMSAIVRGAIAFLFVAGVTACGGSPLSGVTPVADGGTWVDADADLTRDAKLDFVAPPPTGATCRPSQAGFIPLTNLQYNLTVRDLLGDLSAPADGFEPEWYGKSIARPYVPALPPEQIKQYEKAADDLAAGALGRLETLLPCHPAVVGEDPCAGQFISTFGPRAYRRPLTGDDSARLRDAYDVARRTSDFPHGVAAIIAAALRSPHFYKIEERTTALRTARLDSYEVASRLSYLLYRSMPDGPLFAAAAAGELSTPPGIRAQARRMLADPRAQAGVKDFFDQWLGLGRLDGLAKLPGEAPGARALYRDMRTETLMFVESVFSGGGQLSSLLQSNETWINETLAGIYGVKDIVGTEFRKVILEPSIRSGLLTQASILWLTSSSEASPTLRGRFVLENLLCTEFPEPPPDVGPLMKGPGETKRAAMVRSTANPPCRSCHTIVDPIGFGLESFDGTGRHRTVDENGLPLDARGDLTQIADLVGLTTDPKFEGAVELSAKLASGDGLATCVADRWFRFAIPGLDDLTPDMVCRLRALQSRWKSSQNFEELILEIVTNEAFFTADGCLPEKCLRPPI